jgi:hypothetical protein
MSASNARAHAKRKEMTLQRNAHIHDRFRELYEQERLRLDDVVQQLSREFHLAPLTIDRILQKRSLCTHS